MKILLVVIVFLVSVVPNAASALSCYKGKTIAENFEAADVVMIGGLKKSPETHFDEKIVEVEEVFKYFDAPTAPIKSIGVMLGGPRRPSNGAINEAEKVIIYTRYNNKTKKLYISPCLPVKFPPEKLIEFVKNKFKKNHYKKDVIKQANLLITTIEKTLVSEGKKVKKYIVKFRVDEVINQWGRGTFFPTPNIEKHSIMEAYITTTKHTFDKGERFLVFVDAARERFGDPKRKPIIKYSIRENESFSLDEIKKLRSLSADR